MEESGVPKHDIIVIGASFGGIEALSRIVAGLPPKLKASVFVVLHIPAQHESIVPLLLIWRGPLLAVHAVDHMPIEHGRIYVAPPDHHLLLEPDQMRVLKGPKQIRFRPAVDLLFASAALAYGPRVIGIILTGFLNDGTAGLWMVKQRGGITVVQDPHEALAPSMPWSAIVSVPVDYTVPLSQMAAVLSGLVDKQVTEDQSGDLTLTPQSWRDEMSLANYAILLEDFHKIPKTGCGIHVRH